MEALGRIAPTLPSFNSNFKSTANDTTFRCHYSFSASNHAENMQTCRKDANLLATAHAFPVRIRRSLKVVSNATVGGLEATKISEDTQILELKGFGGLEAAHEIVVRVSSDSLQYEEGFLGAISEETTLGPLCLPERVDVPTAISYLTRISSSKVYEVAIESPLQYAPKLSENTGVKIWLKCEDLQPVSTFAFNWGGFYC